jgi:hypothetical protein|tara:strand:- start:827 stop:1093 length:267 start_codon:yes stop_codon:yes gene_type:complete
MSTYTNGARQVKLANRKSTKMHLKGFYGILKDMDEIANRLDIDEEMTYNEDNINEHVKPIYGRELDQMEKMLVLGKLNHRNLDEQENN